MDHEAPEREELNAMEDAAIVKMHLRLFFRTRAKFHRACGEAAEACREFTKAWANAIPMDDWDDDVIAEIARG